VATILQFVFLIQQQSLAYCCSWRSVGFKVMFFCKFTLLFKVSISLYVNGFSKISSHRREGKVINIINSLPEVDRYSNI